MNEKETEIADEIIRVCAELQYDILKKHLSVVLETFKEEMQRQEQVLQRCKPFVKKTYNEACDANVEYYTFKKHNHYQSQKVIKECREILEEIEKVVE